MKPRIPFVPVLALALAALVPLPLGPVAAAETVRCQGRTATVVGTDGNDVLTGTSRRDVIAGLRGDDRMVGLAGDDLICGGRGADTLVGGPGDDRLFGGPDRIDGSPRVRHGDGLVGGPGDDSLSVGADPRADGLPGNPDLVSWADSDRGVVVNLGEGWARGEGRDSIRLGVGESHLTDYDDTFLGTDGADVVHAYDGDDDLALLGGADVAHLDTDESPGDDRARGGPGADQIRSLGGDDRVWAGSGRDYVGFFGSSSTQRILAGPGGDVVETIVADGPDQLLDGGSDADRLLLSVLVDGGSHAFDLGTGRMRLGTAALPVSVTGFETHTFLDGHWALTGSGRPDQVLVNAASTFEARGGDDTFVGSPEDDAFDGGRGDDTYLRDPGGTDSCTSVEHDPEGACGTP